MRKYVTAPIPITLLCVLMACGAAENNPPIAKVKQVWASSGTTYEETDSLAACRIDEKTVRLFATAKEGNFIDVFDAASGRFLQRIGKTGDGVREFRYPNGIVAVRFARQTGGRDSARIAILVVERDNRRVQAFWADDYQPAGIFGEDLLHKPYGVAVSYRGPEGQPNIVVTDNDTPTDKRVHQFALRIRGDRIEARHLRSFGDADAGEVIEPESVVCDDTRQRIYLCDEYKRQKNIKVYTLDGKFARQTFADGLIKGDPEGIALMNTPQRDLLIVTDQQDDVSIWHVFDANDYRHLGAFTGDPTIAKTDGICLFAKPFGPFTRGAMFAVHDDTDIRAYSLEAVLKAIENDAKGK